MTIEEFLAEIITVFKKVGIENPELEAQILAAHVLSVDRTYLFVHKDEELDDKVLLASAALINERCKRRPLQYVMGTADFCGLELAVDERVLIPRPETEELAALGLNIIKSVKAPEICDLCTGSGCIAMAFAANRSDAKVTAMELSPKAFMLASVNCRNYSNIKVLRGDLFEALKEKKQFDLIVTNPPYIPTEDIEQLEPEVKDFEPRMALDGGRDGLDIVRRILEEAPDYLKENGSILMEIGDEQGPETLKTAQMSGKYKDAEIIRDMQGKDRIFKAKKA